MSAQFSALTTVPSPAAFPTKSKGKKSPYTQGPETGEWRNLGPAQALSLSRACHEVKLNPACQSHLKFAMLQVTHGFAIRQVCGKEF